MGNGFDDLFHGLHRQAPFDVDTEKAAELIGRRRGRERREARRGAANGGTIGAEDEI
jgi:hypothetical protein